MKHRLALLAILPAAPLLLWGCRGPAVENPSAPESGDTLHVTVAPAVKARYKRSEWKHWVDIDGDGQDARQEVLIRDSRTPARLSADGCRVEEGSWHDPYTDSLISDPEAVDIDHMVPLSEAAKSGGEDWDEGRRQEFANNLDDGAHLKAVSRRANRRKGDKDPARWMPENPGERCSYLEDWTRIKVRWGLSMDPAEFDTVRTGLEECRAQGKSRLVPITP